MDRELELNRVGLDVDRYGDPHMGKGDKRTFRGKLFKGSHGKTRPHRRAARPETMKKATSPKH